MVFDDVGDHADITDPTLCLKDAALVIVRGDAAVRIAAERTSSEDSLREVKHRGKIAVVPDELRNFFRSFVKDLANRERIVKLEGPVSHLTEKGADAGLLTEHIVDAGETVAPVCRVVLEGKYLLDVDDRVDPEPCQPLVEPPVHHLVDFLSQIGILPVQIRLLLVEGMQIVKILVPGKLVPDRTSEAGAPVAGERTVRPSLFDVEELPIASVRIRAGFFEPFMLIRAMVDYQIHENADIAFFRFSDELVHVRHGAETRIDAVVVSDVVALIRKRRDIAGGQPDDVDPQILQIIKLADDALQIADPVPVAVAETLRIYLVGNLSMPPFSIHNQTSWSE